MALALLPHLCARHRSEILRTHADLEQWALDRCTLPGLGWALFVRDEVQVIGGVIDRGGVGTLWLAGRTGWARHVKHAIRVFRCIKDAGFAELRCRAYLDHHRALRFAEHLGFRRLEVRDNYVQYGMTPC